MSPHATAVVLVTPIGILLVRDHRKRLPILWKFPGGRGEGDETPLDCVVRELQEETGISVSGLDLELVLTEPRKNHTFSLFLGSLPTVPDMNSCGDEGEEIGVFTPEEILDMDNLLPNHRRLTGDVLEDLAMRSAK